MILTSPSGSKTREVIKLSVPIKVPQYPAPCIQVVLPTVVQVAERSGFHVTDLSVSETTLETVFINLTGKDLRE